MRILALAPIALLAAACQVEEGNNSMTVSYNQDVAENAVAHVANGAEEAGEAIVNSAQQAGQAIENGAATVRNTDIDVTVENKAATKQ
jgi:type III secretion system FlhB-like substrate exporter